MHVDELVADLRAEQDELDRVVAELAPEAWATPTPSPGWSVADQIGHLAYFDRTAVMAITDPEQFASARDELFAAALGTPGALDELTLERARASTPEELLAEWRTGRADLAEASATLEDDTRVPWYGPSMSSRSFITARLMETWAHGQDVVDAVGAHRAASERLVHVAQLGVITRSWSYVNRGSEAPDVDIRVELVGPTGSTHEWGPPEAEERITGPLEDFCLVVTQRRHPDDTALVVVGPAAQDWMSVAQAFAGGATDGPAPSTGDH